MVKALACSFEVTRGLAKRVLWTIPCLLLSHALYIRVGDSSPPTWNPIALHLQNAWTPCPPLSRTRVLWLLHLLPIPHVGVHGPARAH